MSLVDCILVPLFQTAELAAAQEKQMEVCEVCGAFLIVGDAQSRIDDHLMGKQHVGYARLRMALEEIMVSPYWQLHVSSFENNYSITQIIIQ